MISLIPISDANPTRRLPVITLALIALNVLAYFFLEPGQPSFSTPASTERFFVKRAVIPCQLNDSCPTQRISLGPGSAPVREPHRSLLSFLGAMLFSTFLHANILHIGGNMLFFWIFGNNVEDYLGRIKYVLFYLAGGLAAGFAQVLSSLHPPASFAPSIGASGAVAAVMGAYFVLFPRARVNVLVPIFFIFTIVQMSAFIVLGLWLVFQLIVPQPGVAWQAHVGGFAFGVIAILLLGGRPQRPRPTWQPQWRY
jgi:membrane associated rhomboid family serine protease